MPKPAGTGGKRPQRKSHHITPQEAEETIHNATTDLQSAVANLPVIKVVGMSGAGKSTLVQRLRSAGYNARAVSQEHSEVQDLWQQFERPLVLIYLTLSLEVQRERRTDVSWTPEYYKLEEKRLTSARIHADLRIDTSTLTPTQVAAVAVAWLRQANVRHATTPLQPRPSTGSASKRVVGSTDTDSHT